MYSLSYILLRVTFCAVITVTRGKGSTAFLRSSCMFLDKKTLLKIWLNPGLNLTIFRGTGPSASNDLLVMSASGDLMLEHQR